ncbi:MAG: hypothetical protein HY805_01650 [Nitrospirae bacterium]|nr:hypothetical protein [Nitrospirota bacterium]
MKDTHPDMEERFFRMILERSAEERLRMGFEMNAMVRRLVTASILQDNPEASDEEIKIGIFRRFYGNDLPPEIAEKMRFEEDKRKIVNRPTKP